LYKEVDIEYSFHYPRTTARLSIAFQKRQGQDVSPP
jgi:hypothetical protein